MEVARRVWTKSGSFPANVLPDLRAAAVTRSAKVCAHSCKYRSAARRCALTVFMPSCAPEVDECERENVDCGGPSICVDGVNEVTLICASSPLLTCIVCSGAAIVGSDGAAAASSRSAQVSLSGSVLVLPSRAPTP